VQGTSAAYIAAGQLNLLGSQMGYKGGFVVLSAQATDTNQLTWNAILKHDVETMPKYKNMHLCTIWNPPDDSTQSAAAAMQTIINKYGKGTSCNMKGVIAPTTVAIAAGAQVLTQDHACKAYALTGLGDPKQMEPFVKSGCVKKFALWSFTLEGEVAACAMHWVLVGRITGKTGQTFSCPKLNHFKVEPNGTVTAGNLEVFNNKNYKDYTF
jgi:rhamnose transport system substrate-binding protein